MREVKVRCQAALTTLAHMAFLVGALYLIGVILSG